LAVASATGDQEKLNPDPHLTPGPRTDKELRRVAGGYLEPLVRVLLNRSVRCEQCRIACRKPASRCRRTQRSRLVPCARMRGWRADARSVVEATARVVGDTWLPDVRGGVHGPDLVDISRRMGQVANRHDIDVIHRLFAPDAVSDMSRPRQRVTDRLIYANVFFLRSRAESLQTAPRASMLRLRKCFRGGTIRLLPRLPVPRSAVRVPVALDFRVRWIVASRASCGSFSPHALNGTANALAARSLSASRFIR
jgi:hypothetical protein